MLQTYTTRLVHKQKFGRNIYLFRFLCEEPGAIVFEGGQYVMLQVPQANGETRFKHYSLSSPSSDPSHIELLVKILPQGVGSDYLSSLQLGDKATFRGPAGVFTLKEGDDHKGRDKVFLATGTGIAPARSIILSHLAKYPDEKFILFWGLQTKEDVYYLEEWKELKKANQNFNFAIFLSREESPTVIDSAFVHGRVNVGLDALKNVQNTPFEKLDIYISGTREIVDSLKEYTLSLGADPTHVVVEKFV